MSVIEQIHNKLFVEMHLARVRLVAEKHHRGELIAKQMIVSMPQWWQIIARLRRVCMLRRLVVVTARIECLEMLCSQFYSASESLYTPDYKPALGLVTATIEYEQRYEHIPKYECRARERLRELKQLLDTLNTLLSTQGQSHS